MSRIERELYDLEEYLRRNDDSADSSAYLTIVGIANDVSEIEAENAKLRQMVWVMRDCLADECKRCSEYGFPCEIDHDMQELGIGICDLATDGELGIEVDE